jgi:predicted AlkP superfamily pyrophosphatase or phosphodiesterase
VKAFLLRLTPALLGVALLAACATPYPQHAAPVADVGPVVILVSFDGTRYDDLDRVPTPNFDRLAAAGLRATGLISTYPSKTFPNHYTLATGLYASNHGLVDNNFFDPALEGMYRLGDTLAVRDGRWYGGEPIWVTAERQGVRAASYFWVGTEASIQGIQPTYFKYYDGDVPNEARVDTVLHWLSLPPPERPGLILLYFSEPDAIAHTYGAAAPEVDSMLVEMDGVLGRLLDGLARLPGGDAVHLVVVSDHGMADVPESNVIMLEDLVDLEGVRVAWNTTQALLYFDGAEDRLWEVYEALGERLENARVYLRDETPERWRYRHNPRIGDLVVAADLGWIIRSRNSQPWTGGGMHGWDPYLRPMHGIFLAMGPRIPAGETMAAFENVHVYPLVARLLDLRPAPRIDGREEVLIPLLREPAPAR